MRRYSADLSGILFETPFVIATTPLGYGLGIATMGINPAGVTTVLGGTSGVNLQPIHPTETCLSSSRKRNIYQRLSRAHRQFRQPSPIDLSRHTAELLPSTPILFQSATASVPYSTATPLFSGNWEILTLGPASFEIALSCIGNGASFTNTPISPNEIVSLFGAGIGPAHPLAIAAKALGDNSLANYQENCEPRQQDERRTHQMTGIPKKSAHTATVVHGMGQYYRGFTG